MPKHGVNEHVKRVCSILSSLMSAHQTTLGGQTIMFVEMAPIHIY